MSDRQSFFAELKQRKVVRVVVLYLAAAFAVLEAADVVFPALGLPESTLTVLVWVASLGLPVAVILAWIFDVTPTGQVTTEVVEDRDSTLAWLSPRTVLLAVMMLAIGAGAGWLARSASPGGSAGVDDKTIAVVPFDNLSSEEANAFFAIGIQDEILTQLQKISALRVISRSSTMRYTPGSGRPPLQTIGEQLDARWIVEGSAARVGQDVRLALQLSETATGRQLWAEVYDGDLSVQGILAFQAQIARRVAESLEATILPTEAARIDRVPTEDSEAYDLYLRGIELFGRRRETELRRALTLFDQAIAIDPDYALAHAGKAMVYAVLPFYGDTPTSESVTMGLAAAYQALAIDSTVAEAHAAVGDLLIHGRYDLEGAEAALRTAIRLSPSSAQAHSWLAEVLIADGQLEEGVAVGRRSVELDPLSAVIALNLGRSLLEAGQHEAAIVQLERAEELDETFAPALEVLGAAYMESGRYDEGAERYGRYAELVGPEAAGLAAYAEAVRRSAPADAIAALDAIEESSWRVPAYTVARAYMQLGESGKALDWLVRARQTGDPLLPFALSSTIFEPLRETPRFRELASRVRR